MKNTLLALPPIALLAACGGPEDDFETAINTALEEEKMCWSVRDDNPSFPMEVSRPILSDGPHPVLAGLEEQGFVTLEETGRYPTRDIVELTPAGAKANFYVPGEGACLGHPKVEEIIRYTYGDNGANENFANVEFTWKMANTPSWVEAKYYQDIPGMSGPEEHQASLQKSSDGWRSAY